MRGARGARAAGSTALFATIEVGVSASSSRKEAAATTQQDADEPAGEPESAAAAADEGKTTTPGQAASAADAPDQGKTDSASTGSQTGKDLAIARELLSGITAPEWQKICQLHQLSVSGVKAQVITRLLTTDGEIFTPVKRRACSVCERKCSRKGNRRCSFRRQTWPLPELPANGLHGWNRA